MFDRPDSSREDELDAELNDHIERLAADYKARGMTSEEATRRARIEFGGISVVKEECRDVERWRAMEALVQDVKIACRGIRTNPGFAAMVIGTLALGIGANTTMFSIVRSVFFKPLAYPNAQQLVTLWESDPARGVTERKVTGSNFVEWEAESSAVEAMGVLPNWTGSSTIFNIVDKDTVERVPGVYASSGLFKALGVPPMLGRSLGPDDDRQSDQRHVVLSHSYWRERFRGNPAILGSAIEVDTFRGGKFTVIGVMPDGFEFPRGARLWLSLGDWGGGPLPARGVDDHGSPWYVVFARLKPNVTVERASAELSAIAKRASDGRPEVSRVTQVRVVPLQELLAGEHSLSLWILFGAVGCVLLIGCANVANLMLSRGIGRRKELLTRMAIGATRSRLAFQLIIESMVLCAFGAMAGLALAVPAQNLVARLISSYVPLAETASVDFAVLGFAALLALTTGLFCGLAPLAEWSNIDWRSRGQTEGTASKRTRQALVVSEVAVAVVLVAAAGLLVRTLANLQAVDVGFQTENLLSVSTDVTVGPLRQRGNAARLVRDVLPRIAGLPGVRSAAASTGTPLEEATATQAITRQDRPPVTAAESPQVIQTAVTPDYFRTMGVPLRMGRHFTEGDSAEGKLVAIVNETAARRYWPGEDPIGKRFAIGSLERFGRFRAPSATGPIEWREIVGVVADIRSSGFAAEIQPEIYYCYAQYPLYAPTFIVRTETDPKSLATLVRREISSVSKQAVVTNVRTIAEVARGSLREQRIRAMLLMGFSGLALILSLLGIYGVLSYTVGQRTQEIGIRMALGADHAEVSRMVVGQALRMTVTGIILGLAGAFAVTRWMTSLLFGVQPLDPLTFVVSCALLLGVSVLASYAPVRRAIRVDPALALRSE
jgi:putative ABC transport system permease protein